MMQKTCSIGWRILALLLSWGITGEVSFGQIEPEEPDDRLIDYHGKLGLDDPIARLQQRLASGQARLKFEPQRGYLDSVLKELDVPISSQVLVFSKTSSQSEQTSPKTPRAIYFSDEVYVAWVPDGSVIDLAAQDSKRGTIFYTLEQKPAHQQKFVRPESCIQCHVTPKTLNVPGLLVRSVHTAADGTPLSTVLGFVNGHNSSLEQRWGGWYVSGTHERALHLGNVFASASSPEGTDLSAGANVTDLRGRFDSRRYLSPHSDLVALLVLEHEMRMHNLITRAHYETRHALAASKEPNELLADWEKERIAKAGELLLEYMLFRNEAALSGPVTGTSGFTAEFQEGVPRDSRGRSLRRLDLRKRLLRYPCSYLVYTPAFDALPQEMKSYLWRRLAEILTGEDRSVTYAGMDRGDRQAVLEILRDTKPEFRAWLGDKPRFEAAGVRTQAKR